MLLFAGLLVKTKALASIQRPKARFSYVQMCVFLVLCVCEFIFVFYVCVLCCEACIVRCGHAL